MRSPSIDSLLSLLRSMPNDMLDAVVGELSDDELVTLRRAFTRKNTGNEYFGKDCPKGKVQVEFIGVDPRLKHGEYGWMPSDRAFADIYVDGERFNIQTGNIMCMDGKSRRGISISFPCDAVVHRHSLNALNITLKEVDEAAS